MVQARRERALSDPARHKHVVVDNEHSRGLSQRLAEYIRHLADLKHPAPPHVDPSFDVPMPGVGGLGAIVYPAFEGLDPETSQKVTVERIAIPCFRWETQPFPRERFPSTYFARWCASVDSSVQRTTLAFSDMLASNLKSNQALSLHVYGIGVFMNAAGLLCYSMSPEFLHNLNGRALFAPLDRDLRVPRSAAQGLSDNELCAVTVDHMWHALPHHPGVLSKLFGDRISLGQKYVFATSWLCKEVGAGGFAQFFSNPPGDLAMLALSGLEAVGATRLAAVVRRALESLGEACAVDATARSRFLTDRASRATLDALSSCGSEFVSLLATEQLDARMAAFIRNTPEHFFRD